MSVTPSTEGFRSNFNSTSHNGDFCCTKDPRNIIYGMVATYEILMSSERSQKCKDEKGRKAF